MKSARITEYRLLFAQCGRQIVQELTINGKAVVRLMRFTYRPNGIDGSFSAHATAGSRIKIAFGVLKVRDNAVFQDDLYNVLFILSAGNQAVVNINYVLQVFYNSLGEEEACGEVDIIARRAHGNRDIPGGPLIRRAVHDPDL